MIVSLFARGRIAWYLAAGLGAVLLVVGLVMSLPWLAVVGGAFLVLGGLFLILSYVTHGQSD